MTITVLIVITVLIFDFINGFHDTATAVATSITTRALKPQTAIVICAIIWNIITWYFGIPSSSSHALIGALVGGGIAYNLKFDVVNWYNLFHDVVIWIFIAPIIGFTVGYILMILLNWILKPFKPGIINKIFLKLQVVAGSLMALNHGSNDAQKSMGLITMALLSGGLISTFEVPTWVIACCAIAMALGTASGGKKIIKTMGSGMAKLTPVNGFAAQTGGAAVIFLATLFHAPVSTTHIISTTVMGVGASKRIKSVKWGVAQNIVWAWILTIPITAALSAFIIFIAKLFI
jgi:PiT family inorganic phosphate transporter